MEAESPFSTQPWKSRSITPTIIYWLTRHKSPPSLKSKGHGPPLLKEESKILETSWVCVIQDTVVTNFEKHKLPQVYLSQYAYKPPCLQSPAMLVKISIPGALPRDSNFLVHC